MWTYCRRGYVTSVRPAFRSRLSSLLTDGTRNRHRVLQHIRTDSTRGALGGTHISDDGNAAVPNIVMTERVGFNVPVNKL